MEFDQMKVGSYTLKQQIGQGSFAPVWLAEHSLSNLKVAVKVIDRTAIRSQCESVRLIREINLIKEMDHPFISKLFDLIITARYACLVMEYAENGSVLEFINEHGRLSEVSARRYFSQLLSALEYLHEVRKVAHRDLKAENILLDRHFNIRLIDFGLSNSFSTDAHQFHSVCGSPAYAAPELISAQNYTKSVDIWSSGVLLFAMVCGELPFDDPVQHRMLQKIKYVEPRYPEFLSPPLADLLRKLLTKDPANRITIDRIKTHPWFSQTEYARFLQLQFSADEQWLVRVVDQEVIAELATLGIDIVPVTQSLLRGEYTEATALYSLLRRYNLTDRIKEFMDMLAEKVEEMPVHDSMAPLAPVLPTRQYTNVTRAGPTSVWPGVRRTVFRTIQPVLPGVPHLATAQPALKVAKPPTVKVMVPEGTAATPRSAVRPRSLSMLKT
jgi:serine/threonine protein kinase